MTPLEWKALPPLVSRADVLAVGIPAAALPDLIHEMQSADDKVPWRKIGAIRGLCGNHWTRKARGTRNSKPGTRNGKGRQKLLFVKATVSVLLPKEWR